MNKEVNNRIVFMSPSIQGGWEEESRISDFLVVKSLGQGAYGKVHRAIHRRTQLVYALKEINKTQIRHQGKKMIEQLNNELRIMYQLNHPHIIKLFNHFEEDKNVYLITEFARQGQLYAKLFRQPQKKFSLQIVSKYIIQTIYALDEMHKKGIIHRDMKPENVLLDECDNIKLCDFGWSAYLGPDETRKTFCGTIDYMAPELVQRDIKYDHNVDIWAVGVLTYELLTGISPFSPTVQTNNAKYIESKTRQNIKDINYQFPSNFPSVSGKDFISKILKIDPKDRMQLQEMKKHRFIQENCDSKILQSLDKFDMNDLQIQKEIDRNKQQALTNLLNTDDIQNDDDYKALQLKFTDQEILKATRPDSIINKEFHEDFKKMANHVDNIKQDQTSTNDNNNNKPIQKVTGFEKKQIEDLSRRNQELQKKNRELQIALDLEKRKTIRDDMKPIDDQTKTNQNKNYDYDALDKNEVHRLNDGLNILKMEKQQLELELKTALNSMKEKKDQNEVLNEKLEKIEKKYKNIKDENKKMEKQDKDNQQKISELEHMVQKKDFDLQMMSLKLSQNNPQFQQKDEYYDKLQQNLIQDLNMKRKY